ncbi:hypothetical protein CVT25_015048 [Psilocybe cyanescens]|uniref:DUF202 domain-containing protein n=1 Tax=Psilocybe cyanescens TaxID=93625 RepID=A0A409WRX8_PSICY|nr:hypothetical protein CVT25_015048 [Psilocybe cyanescens]
MQTTSDFDSEFKLDGGSIGVGQPTSESTPLLSSDAGCEAGSSSLRSYNRSPSSQISQQQIRHSEHRKTSERDSDEENIYGLSSQKNKSPDRYLSAHTPSYTTLDNDSETCQGPLDSLAVCPSRSKSRFTLPEGISLRLENSGSVARDHLASERTFLAYMRTSLAIASSGVALVQLFSVASASATQGSTHLLRVYIRPLGASTVLVGLLVLFIGVTRYFTVQSALTKGYFPAARIATGFIAVVLTALVTLTFALMLAGKLESRHP